MAASKIRALLADVDDENTPDRVRVCLRSLCADYLGGAWTDCPPHHFAIKAVTGGMVNYIFLVTCSVGADEQQALVRLYANEDISAVVEETAVFSVLSERRLGPRLLAVFPGGRIEQFIPSRPLKTHEISQPNMISAIAPRMSHMHALSMPIRKTVNYPNKVRLWLDEWAPIGRPFDVRPVTLQLPQHMLDKLPSSVTVADLHGEITLCEEFMKTSTAAGSQVVFAHNDLHGMNMLLVEGCDVTEEGVMRNGKTADDGLLFIDIEFASYNYRAFDIANTLAEFAFDYSLKEQPYFVCEAEMSLGATGEQRKRLFIEKYVDEVYKHSPLPSDFCGDRAADVASLHSSVEAHLACVNLYWGVWNLRQAELTTTDADFWSIGMDRLSLYYLQKGTLEKK